MARPTDPEWAVPEGDAAWFEAHPRRSHRVREYVQGELHPTHNRPPKRDGWRLAVVVRQVEPGVRIRAAFWILDPWSLNDVPEPVAAALFDWTFKGLDTGVPGGPIAQIHQQGSDELH